MSALALFSDGRRVTVCCGTHRPDGCCDPDDCGPCCPECLACPEQAQWTPERRREAAAVMRAEQAVFAARLAERAAAVELGLRRAFHAIVVLDLDEHLSDLAAATRNAACVRVAYWSDDLPHLEGSVA